MFPWQLEKKLQQTAQWMLTKNYEKLWWTPAVITSYNNDDNPTFSLSDADEIFQTLYKRNLLTRTTEIITYNNEQQRISVSKFNLHKIDQWEKLSNKNGFLELTLMPTIKAFGKHPIFMAIIIFIATAFSTQILSNIADDIYPKIKLLIYKIFSNNTTKQVRPTITALQMITKRIKNINKSLPNLSFLT